MPDITSNVFTSFATNKLVELLWIDGGSKIGKCGFVLLFFGVIVVIQAACPASIFQLFSYDYFDKNYIVCQNSNVLPVPDDRTATKFE